MQKYSNCTDNDTFTYRDNTAATNSSSMLAALTWHNVLQYLQLHALAGKVLDQQ